MSTQVFDVLIVGGGAVGVAVAREMTLLGKRCLVCEKNVDVLSEASSGNTGHLARQVHPRISICPFLLVVVLFYSVQHDVPISLNICPSYRVVLLCGL